MTRFRPANLNKRLVSSTGGNGGVIGPNKTPYCLSCDPCATLTLGHRYVGSGRGSCTGRFTLKESFTGKKFNCNVVPTDCAGNFICCGPGTTKWFVAPSCTEVIRCWLNRNNAVTVANSCMGSCGWFVPDATVLGNGYLCRSYWDPTTNEQYWSSSEDGYGAGYRVSMFNGVLSPYAVSGFEFHVRAFRCTAT